MEAHQKIVLPGRGLIISYCALGSALAGQPEGLKSLTEKFSQALWIA
jgi:hypothetical protein